MLEYVCIMEKPEALTKFLNTHVSINPELVDCLHCIIIVFPR